MKSSAALEYCRVRHSLFPTGEKRDSTHARPFRGSTARVDEPAAPCGADLQGQRVFHRHRHHAGPRVFRGHRICFGNYLFSRIVSARRFIFEALDVEFARCWAMFPMLQVRENESMIILIWNKQWIH
jgi:hypothetical protein